MRYRASLDTTARILTIGCYVLFAGIIGTAVYKSVSVPEDERVFTSTILTLVILPTILFIAWLYSVRSYELRDGFLLINRPIGPKRISIPEIKTIRRIAREELKGTIRTFGVGGLFGYYGQFYIPALGPVTFFATNSKKLLLITTESRKSYAISPDDEEIVNQLERTAMELVD